MLNNKKDKFQINYNKNELKLEILLKMQEDNLYNRYFKLY